MRYLIITVFVSFILFVGHGRSDAVCPAFTKMSCSAPHTFNPFHGKPGPTGPPGDRGSTMECPTRLTSLEKRLKAAIKYVEDAITKVTTSKCKVPKYIYRRFPRKLSYMEARQFCKAQGGDLPQYGARTEFERGHLITSSGASLNERFWFGLNDGVQEGTWKWIDGSSVIKQSVGFNRAEPNERITENCACNNGGAGLIDVACSMKLSVICEISRF